MYFCRGLRIGYNMNIYSWNVNGLRSALKKGFTDWFAATKPDILCLQEVRAEVDQIPEEVANPDLGHIAVCGDMNCGAIATVTERSEEMPVVQSTYFDSLRGAPPHGQFRD